jgi:hypothetical protein
LQKTFPLLILKKLYITDICEDCINLAQLTKTFLNPISSYLEFKTKLRGVAAPSKNNVYREKSSASTVPFLVLYPQQILTFFKNVSNLRAPIAYKLLLINTYRNRATKQYGRVGP